MGPQDKKVIETRDVTFDESRKYNPEDLRPALLNVSKNLYKLSSSLTTNSLGVESETQSVTDSVNSYQSSTTVVDTMPTTQQVEAQHALPTPENTPAPTQPEEASALPQALPQASPRARPRQEIVGDVGELNNRWGNRGSKAI
jgi:hypothetical protein